MSANTQKSKGTSLRERILDQMSENKSQSHDQYSFRSSNPDFQAQADQNVYFQPPREEMRGTFGKPFKSRMDRGEDSLNYSVTPSNIQTQAQPEANFYVNRSETPKYASESDTPNYDCEFSGYNGGINYESLFDKGIAEGFDPSMAQAQAIPQEMYHPQMSENSENYNSVNIQPKYQPFNRRFSQRVDKIRRNSQKRKTKLPPIPTSGQTFGAPNSSRRHIQKLNESK